MQNKRVFRFNPQSSFEEKIVEPNRPVSKHSGESSKERAESARITYFY